jgi:uncharacterized protein YfbU (UPF0304 family)
MKKKIKITPSSGNVFKDLELPNPEKLLLEAEIKLLIQKLEKLILKLKEEEAQAVIEIMDVVTKSHKPSYCHPKPKVKLILQIAVETI